MAEQKNLKNPMPVRAPQERIADFEEVALGYTREMAVAEANRCLHCKNAPCVKSCPVNIDIPNFIGKIAAGDTEGAYHILSLQSSLPAVCGRVCPQETQCESTCTRGIKGEPVAIGRLERYAADCHLAGGAEHPHKAQPNGHKVAVVGSGPSGLSCAGELARRGYAVTVFEALHKAGGVLVYGIPEFRLPKKIVESELETLKQMGVRFMTNTIIGKTFAIDELIHDEAYEAVFIGSGAGLPRFSGIPGEGLCGVYSANEFLTRTNLMKAYLPDSATPIRTAKRVAVIGGGNVAMDAARVAKRLGAQEVTIVYRRSEAELPARKEEYENAIEEGIQFRFLTAPIEILSDEKGFARGLLCEKMTLGAPDASGRRRPVPVENSDFIVDTDCVIVAIGTSPNPLITSTTDGIITNRKGGIETDENGMTSRPGIFAGGDAVTGAATVILAMSAGKKAAAAIDKYLQDKK